MKRNLLTIAVFSILAILPFSAFGQGDSEALFKQLQKEFFDDKNYAKAIETATKLIGFSTTNEKAKIFVYEIRAASLQEVYFSNGGKPGSDYTAKYPANTVEKLRLAISDNVKAINFYKQLSTKEIADDESIRDDSANVAMIYLNLGKYNSHSPDDFAKAEEYFKLALTKKADANAMNKKIVQSLAGQYKFNEARDLAKRVLAAETENNFDATLSTIVEAFDSMGEYQFADAFLLEQAGIRKAANKSLTPIQVVKAGRENAQKASLGFSNPMTVMELNRKGALLAITQQCDKAMPLLEKSLAVFENPTAARYAIPYLFNQKNFEVAWQTSNGLVDFNKEDVVALSFRGLLYGMQNDAVKAEADLSKAIRIFPELAAIFNSLDNAKKIYQAQNFAQKVSEMGALEKKLAALNAEMNPSSILGDLGIQTILEEDEEEEEEEPTSKPTPTPTPAVKTSSNVSCVNIFAGKGCGNITIGMTKTEVTNLFGTPEKIGFASLKDQFRYYSKGFSIVFDSNNKAIRISFDGLANWNNDGKTKPFQGNPDKFLTWKASIQQVQTAYGKPSNTESWTDENQKAVNLTYNNIEFHFRDGKLAVITVF